MDYIVEIIKIVFFIVFFVSLVFIFALIMDIRWGDKRLVNRTLKEWKKLEKWLLKPKSKTTSSNITSLQDIPSPIKSSNES